MDEHSLLATDGSNFTDRLQRPDFIVRVHDADQRGAAGHHATDIVGIDEAVAINRQDRDAAAQAFEEGARLQGCWMLDRAGDEMRARLAAEEATEKTL